MYSDFQCVSHFLFYALKFVFRDLRVRAFLFDRRCVCVLFLPRLHCIEIENQCNQCIDFVVGAVCVLRAVISAIVLQYNLTRIANYFIFFLAPTHTNTLYIDDKYNDDNGDDVDRHGVCFVFR